MAHAVWRVGYAEFKYAQADHEKFHELKRYVRDQIGADTLAHDLLSGVRVPAELVPRRAYLRWKAIYSKKSAVRLWSEATGKDPFEFSNPLGDVTGTHFGWLLSRKAKELIERMEPNTHQFLPFEITKQGGSAIERPFWLLNVCVCVDAMAANRSNLTGTGPAREKGPENWELHSRSHNGANLERIDVGLQKKDCRVEHAIWADSRWKHQIFVSDGLAAEISAARIEGIDLRPFPNV